MARLTAPNGAVVTVPDEKVDEMVRRGFTAEKAESKPAPKKAAAKSSSK